MNDTHKHTYTCTVQGYVDTPHTEVPGDGKNITVYSIQFYVTGIDINVYILFSFDTVGLFYTGI